MIQFLVVRRNRYGLEHLLSRRSDSRADRVRIVPYEQLRRRPELEPGVVVFTDLDMLDERQRQVVREIATNLEPHREHLRVLNDPRRIALRPELLERLHALGINQFRAVPADRATEDLRFPVFLREAHRHTGALTELLADGPALERALTARRLLGYRPRDLLVVEYQDVAVAGVYHKYSAFYLDGTVIPRYRNSADSWQVKMGYTSREEKAQELDYVDRNPHSEAIARIFRRAEIDYGRADYGMVDGRPQIWEINLNPTFGRRWWQPRSGSRANDPRSQLKDIKRIFFERFLGGIAKLDRDSASGPGIPVAIDAKRLASLRHRPLAASRETFHRILASNRPPWQLFGRAANAVAEHLAR